jgi:hypothetical protein
MIPKDKAEELFMIYVNKGMSQIKPVINRVIRKEMAKQCALIAVDEIIDSSPMYYTGFEYESNLEYWQEVKTEIKKL